MLKNKMFLFPEDTGAGDTTTPAETAPPTTAPPAVDIEALQSALAKAQKAVNDLTAENAEKKRQLKEKMTAEELKDAEIKEKADALEALKAQIEQSKLTANQAIAESLVATVKVNADVKDDDAEFTALIHSITSTDKDSTTKLATYLAKVVKQAYDKGVADTTAEALANTGDGSNVGGDGTGKGEKSEYQKYLESKPQPISHVDLG